MGLGAMLAAPAIVHAGNLMPVSSKNLMPVWHEMKYYGPETFQRYSGFDVLGLKPDDLFPWEMDRIMVLGRPNASVN